MCRHNWQPILPKSSEVSEDHRVDFVIEKMLSRLGDMFYCDKCNCCGHAIKSHRGGVRRHISNYFIEKANEIRNNYGFELLNTSPSSKTEGDAAGE